MIEKNIVKIKQRISSIGSAGKQVWPSVEIVAVTKGREIPQIEEAITAGISNIAENKVQEAIGKFQSLGGNFAGRRLKWHMVGHLQTNKARDAVGLFDLIHSVDSLRLAAQIDKEAAKINKLQEVLIEVKTSPEATKFGFTPEETADALKAIAELKHIKVKGMMTIAPMVGNPEEARPYFRSLRQLRDKISDMRLAGLDLQILSMGMTDDFQVAIEEGSNMIRLGRAIFDGSEL